ncbi:MAG: hypothetical protein WAK48_10895 [Candidatus Acidiferrum sp.]|jgi:hypothetical protein
MMPTQKLVPREIAETKSPKGIPFEKIFLPCLLAMEPPKTESATPRPDLQIVNPYVPLAHRNKTE